MRLAVVDLDCYVAPVGQGVRWLALAIVLSGMECRGEGALGKQEHYSFVLDAPAAGSLAFLGPVLDGGAHAEIMAIANSGGACHAAATPYVGVESTNPAVAAFALGSGGLIVATTGVAGSADLELLDAQSHVVDSVTVEVGSAASVQFVDTVSPVQVIAAGSAVAYMFDVAAFDSSGNRLVTDPSRFVLTATGALSVSSDDTGSFVESFATGSATVTATLDDRSATLEVDSVTLADVTSIVVNDGPTYEAFDDQWDVWFTPMTAVGPVLGAGCTWQLSNPAAQVVFDTVADSENETNLTELTVALPPPVNVTATCTIGSASMTVTLSR